MVDSNTSLAPTRPRVCGVLRAATLALLVFSLMVGEAQATQEFEVHVGGEMPLRDYPGAAIGLLVPGAGPETSREQALAALLRGKVENSLRGGMPAGPPLIRVSQGAPDGGPNIFVTLPQGGTQPNDRRYLVVVSGPGYDGILTSDSTRIPGLVSIADIAPTALGEKGALGSRPDPHPAQTLRVLDARIDDHNDARLPASIVAAVLILLLALWRPRAGLLGFGAVLAANLLLGVTEVSSFWPTQIVIALAGLSGLALEIVLTSELAIGLFLAGVVAAYLVVLGVDASAVALSPFGPTQNARFYGISNLLETMLLVPALGGAYYLQRRLGWLAFAAVAVLTFATVAANRFGADGGGAIVLAVAFACLAALLAGLRGARLAVVLGAAVVVGGGLVALDAAIGPSSHITRAVGSGPGGLASDLRDRVQLSWERIVHKPSVTVVVAVCLPILVVLVVRLLRSDIPLWRRALPLAFALGIAVSLVVNDSPNDVITAGLVGYVAVEAVMLRDRCAPLWPSVGSSPGSRSSLPAAAQRRK
jgi:hypothetical protein